MLLSEQNILNNLRVSKDTLESLNKTIENKEVELISKGNQLIEKGKSYVVILKNETSEDPKNKPTQFIPKAVKIGSKFEYIDLFDKDYIKEISKEHTLNIIQGVGQISFGILEPKPEVTTKKASKKEIDAIPEALPETNNG